MTDTGETRKACLAVPKAAVDVHAKGLGRWSAVKDTALVMAGLIASSVLLAESADGADHSRDIARCAAIHGDLARLECFDSLSRRLGLDRPRQLPVPTTGTGEWRVSKKTNPIDDSTTVTLVLASESGASKWGDAVLLVARCKSTETEVYIKWGDYLGSEAEVLTRVGTNDAQTSRWNLSTDSTATFYPGRSIEFLRHLVANDRLVAQVTPYNESPVTAVFSLAGLENAIVPLKDTCGWR